MLVPLSWLRDFAPFDLDPIALGEVFDDLGMVVESVRRVGEGLEGVVVARVLSIDAIPAADKIRQVMVETGGPAPVQVVCGAWNFEVGDTVALATVGSVLPGDFEITQRKMKGVVSDGMLCSARELELGEDGAGILTLDARLTPGSAFGPAVGIVPDVVYDLAIEGNRPDAMCVAGVARDAAARLRLPFAIPEPTALVPRPADGQSTRASPLGDGPPRVVVTVEDPALCPRFTATVLEGVTIAESPPWLARRLTLAGMRPINSVVDASNYVMLELGQPTHPYHLDRLRGAGFVIRAARPGEQVETLDGLMRTLGDSPYPDCLICDAEGTPVGIAGIMGGASSEISPTTTKVVLEAANFTPMDIARTSKRIGLRSEASQRFERGVDLAGIARAVDRFCELVALTSPGLSVPAPMVDVQTSSARIHPAPIGLRTERVNAMLGTSLTDDDVAGLLAPIGFFTLRSHPGRHEVTPPTFRPDVVHEIDVIEEVARHHGYANIVRTVPRSPFVGRLTPYQSERRAVRSVLTGAGLSEAVYAQLLGPGDHRRAGLPEDAIAAVDPLVREESLLRTSLRPGLLRAAAFNTDRRNGDLGLFEIGHTFRVGHPALELPDEREILGIIVAGAGVPAVGRGAAGAVNSLRRLAAALRLARFELVAVIDVPGMHPSRTADVLVDDEVLGHVGEIDPEVSAAWGIESRVGWAEVDLERLLDASRSSELAVTPSRFPSSDIDLAFIVPDEVPAAAVERTLAAVGGELLERLSLFDVYRGAGMPADSRSLAYRLRFCAPDHTLTDAEVGSLRAACIDAVESTHDARLRG